jgi:hypothetical protein
MTEILVSLPQAATAAYIQLAAVRLGTPVASEHKKSCWVPQRLYQDSLGRFRRLSVAEAGTVQLMSLIRAVLFC